MPKMRMVVKTGYPGCDHMNEVDVGDAEWMAMTQEEQDKYLDEAAHEFMWDHVECYAHLVNDENAESEVDRG